MVRWVFLLLSHPTCLSQITWQKQLGYWGRTIRLLDLSYHWYLYLVGNTNAHLITRLKDTVLMLSSVAEVTASPSCWHAKWRLSSLMHSRYSRLARIQEVLCFETSKVTYLKLIIYVFWSSLLIFRRLYPTACISPTRSFLLVSQTLKWTKLKTLTPLPHVPSSPKVTNKKPWRHFRLFPSSFAVKSVNKYLASIS